MEPLGRRRQEGGGGGGGAEAASTEEGVGEATREFDGRGGKGGEGEEGGSTFSQKRRKETTTSITEREVKSAAAEEEGSGEVTASTAVNNNNNGSFEAEAEVERGGGGRGGEGEGDRHRPTLEGGRKEEEENKRTSDKDQGRRRPSCNNAINNNNSSTIVPPLSEVDAVSEGYKSIVRVINRASSSFREGKKWRCAADEEDLNGSRRLTASQSGYQLGFSSRSSLTSSSRPGSGKRRNKRRKEPRGQRKRGGDGGFMAAGAMERAATMDVGGGECGAADQGVENSGRLGRGRARRLVRQKATNEENSGGATSNTLSPPSMSGASSIEVVDETASLLTASSTAVAAAAAAANGSNKENNNRLRVQPRTGMPARQWTVDTCTGLKTPMQEVMQSSTSATPGTAYLLRPVSRTSIVSGNSGNATAAAAADGGGGGGADRRDRSRSPMPRSPARTGGERIRLGDLASRSAASSFNRSMDASVCSSADPAGSNRALTAAERKDRRIYERALLPHLQAGHQRRTRLQKQRTSDSAPFAGQAALGGNGTMMTPQGGGSAVQLPRQPSTASSGQSYAASAQGAGVGVGGVSGGVGAGVGLSTSFSHQGITLVRGASCSLVDIPTYLGPSVAAGGGVELAPMGATVGGGVVPSPAAAAAGAIAVAASRQASERRKKQGSISSGSGRRPPPGGPGAPRPRQQIDLTKKKKHSTASVSGAEKGGSSGGGRAERGEGRGSSKGSGTRKTQWTVLCVSITLLTLAVTLVGGMLSVGSHYQEMVIARRWEELNSLRNNKSSFGRASGGDSELSGGGLGLEPFVIVPLDDDDSADGDAVDEEDLGGKNNSTSPSAVSDSESGSGTGGGSGEKNRQLLLPIIFPELLAGSEEIRRMSELAKRPRKGASN